jgi:DNA-binding response OmpR family regulator
MVVEDERKLAQVLCSALQAEHYDVVIATTGEDGFYRVNAERFDLVVLDLMLPGRSGLDILQCPQSSHSKRRGPGVGPGTRTPLR